MMGCCVKLLVLPNNVHRGMQRVRLLMIYHWYGDATTVHGRSTVAPVRGSGTLRSPRLTQSQDSIKLVASKDHAGLVAGGDVR